MEEKDLAIDLGPKEADLDQLTQQVAIQISLKNKKEDEVIEIKNNEN